MAETQIEILEPTSELTAIKKRLRKRRPTPKQIKALQFKRQGLSTRQALIQAGYSMHVANKGNRFFEQIGVQNHLSSLVTYLESLGLNEQRMAEKIKEFIEAEEPIIKTFGPVKDAEGNELRKPDRRTQIEGVKLWHEILKDIRNENDGKNRKIKREMKITEYIGGKEQ